MLLLNGQDVGEKTAAQPASFAVTLPQGAARRQVAMLIEAAPNQPTGLWSRVSLELGAR